MERTSHARRRVAVCGVVGLSAAALATGLLISPSQGRTAAAADPMRGMAKHKVVASGLDNPRQLSTTPSRRLLVAEAGHGSYKKSNCVGEGEEETCIGRTGKVTVMKPNGTKRRSPMRRLLSGAGADGTFATGPDGAGKQRGGPYFAIITYAPPEFFPEGIPSRTAGKLLKKRPGHRTHIVADITRYEKKHDPDGEGFDSNPYSLLALRNKVLVTDAAGDSVLRVTRGGKVRLWHKMKEYGPKIDPVPTTVSLGADGNVYVGELHSEIPHKAKVWKLTKQGKVLRTYGGFTTVTGVAKGRNGALYVSELFGGSCGFDQIPSCFPGQVTRIKNGKRKTVSVPFPAGITTVGRRTYVSAFSVSPKTGFGGNPDWSGQVWRLKL